MKCLKILLAMVTLLGSLVAAAAPPIEFNAAVRDGDGYVMAEKSVKFMLEIVDRASGGKVLYNETQSVTTDTSGMARIMIGEGDYPDGDFEEIDWSKPRFLTVRVDAEGSGNYRSLGTIQLLGAPIGRHAAVSSGLMLTAANGDVMELTVDNTGNLKWEVVENPGNPAYDLSKVPEQLYFIGNFNKWDIEEAVEMTKLSDTKFSIDRHLTQGEIFKFVAARKWGPLDWSGTAIKIGEPVPLREFGDTPAFYGPEDDYTITVDFYKFTMLITKK